MIAQGMLAQPPKDFCKVRCALWLCRLCPEQPTSLSTLFREAGQTWYTGSSMDAYRCEAKSVEGFIQQLAVSYLRHGYWFYVNGWVPEHKDPRIVDAKLISRYGIDISKWARLRRKRLEQANIQYLRHDRYFVLLATHGQHRFFIEESRSIRDARCTPIRYAGYSVSYRANHPHVRIDARQIRVLTAHLLSIAKRTDAQSLIAILWGLPFAPYAPVRRQMFNLVRAINREREAAGLALLPAISFRMRRAIVKPFEGTGSCSRWMSNGERELGVHSEGDR